MRAGRTIWVVDVEDIAFSLNVFELLRCMDREVSSFADGRIYFEERTRREELPPRLVGTPASSWWFCTLTGMLVARAAAERIAIPRVKMWRRFWFLRQVEGMGGF